MIDYEQIQSSTYFHQFFGQFDILFGRRKVSGWMIMTLIREEALAFNPAAKTTLGSTTVPEVPPVLIVQIPNTRFPRLSSIT